jgi:hypothetical protein
MLSRTPALGGNKKFVIDFTLQTICLLATFRRGSVYRGRVSNGFLLQAQEKPSRDVFAVYERQCSTA